MRSRVEILSGRDHIFPYEELTSKIKQKTLSNRMMMRQMQIKLRLRQLCDRSSWAINTPTRQAQLMDLSFSNNAF